VANGTRCGRLSGAVAGIGRRCRPAAHVGRVGATVGHSGRGRRRFACGRSARWACSLRKRLHSKTTEGGRWSLFLLLMEGVTGRKPPDPDGPARGRRVDRRGCRRV